MYIHKHSSCKAHRSALGPTCPSFAICICICTHIYIYVYIYIYMYIYTYIYIYIYIYMYNTYNCIFIHAVHARRTKMNLAERVHHLLYVCTFIYIYIYICINIYISTYIYIYIIHITVHSYKQFMQDAQKCTWPNVSIIRSQCEVELMLDVSARSLAKQSQGANMHTCMHMCVGVRFWGCGGVDLGVYERGYTHILKDAHAYIHIHTHAHTHTHTTRHTYTHDNTITNTHVNTYSTCGNFRGRC